MKLRTEMVRVDGEMRLTLGASPGRYSAREHDAMAAHALLQTMGDISRGEDGRGRGYARIIQERAAEILDGWMGEDRG